MRRREYFTICMGLPARWLRASAASPSVSMTRTHVALCLLAARKLEGFA